MTEAEVDADASLGDVMEVQLQLGGERGTLSFGVLDHTAPKGRMALDGSVLNCGGRQCKEL